MMGALSRALMRLAAHVMGAHRRGWAAAMRAEYEAAADAGDALPFAAGCLFAAWRDLLGREEGYFTLTSYALALGLMLPMAAFQIGCAVLGAPYLYPPGNGLPVMLEGGEYAGLLHSVYLSGVPSFTLLSVLLGAGHVRLAWAMLDRDWAKVMRTATAMFAAVATLVLVMSAFFLDSSRVLVQAGVLAIELAMVAVVARWHAELPAPPALEPPG